MWKLYELESKLIDKFSSRSFVFVLVDPLQKYFCTYYSLKELYQNVNNYEFNRQPLDYPVNKNLHYALILEAKSRISILNDYPELFL